MVARMRRIGEAIDTRKVGIRLCERKAAESGCGVRIDGAIGDDFVVARVSGVGKDHGIGLRNLMLNLQVEFEVGRILELGRSDSEDRRCVRRDGDFWHHSCASAGVMIHSCFTL
jgi:hypothetical protein